MKAPIIVGVDIRDLKVAKTGIKTYLEELCREFRKMNNQEIQFKFLDTSLPIYIGKNKPLKWMEHIRYQVWKQLVLPIKAWFNACDIVFCVDNCVPYIHLGYKTIHSIHDAFCFESPEQYGKLWLWSYKNTTVPGARRSPFVITATQHGKKQLSHYMNIPEEKLIVVHDGPKRVEHDENDVSAAKIIERFGLTNANYILHVGSMFKRKNIVALIHAFSEVKKLGYTDLKLVLAGPLPANKLENDHELILNAIAAHKLELDMVITGFLTDQEVSKLYSNALMYVFPSVNEGFGLPILECFQHDLPVIVSNNTCLPEVGGDAVLTFDPFNINDLCEKIETVLKDADLRKEMVRKGKERLKYFTWESTALQIVAVFKKAMN